MSMTVSVSKGRTAILHDVRKEISANVDVNLTEGNEIFIDELAEYKHNLVAYTDAHFQPYIDEFNEGKKPSRQIQETYTEHLAKENEKLIKKAEENKKNGVKSSVRKPTQLAHEYVLQFGNRDNNSTLQMDGETEEQYRERLKGNREGLQEALEQLREKYPHAHILLATYHQDEPNGTPHMHILVQFEGEDYKKGLFHQISMSKALELDGLERSQNRGDYAINRWTKDISDNILEPQLEKHLSQEREVLGEHRKHEDIVFFREKARAEAEALQAEREQTRQTHERLDGEIDRQKEYAEALKEGGGYTDKDGERQFISYEQSLEHLENQKDRLTKNVEAYKKGGFYYDWEKREGYSVPDGGMKKAITDKREEAERIIGDAKGEAERITSKAEGIAERKIQEGNDKFEDMINRLDGYKTSQKAQIDQEVEKYAQDQRNALEGKLEGLRGKLEQTREAISKNNEAINGQADTYSHNEKLLKEQTADLQETFQKLTDTRALLEAATKELTAKEKQIQGLDKVTAKIRKQEYSIGTEQVGGMFNKHDVTVVEGISPKELERVFQRASINQAAKDTVAQAEKTAQKTLQGAQGTIDQAQAILQGQQQRQAELDALEREIKDRNNELLQANQKLERSIRAYHNGWTDRDGNQHEGIDQLRQDYHSLQSEYKGLQEQETEAMSNLKDLSEQADRKLAVIQSELSPEQMYRILSDSVATNLIQDTMLQTCLQLEQRGLLENGSMAFIKLDKRPLIERFKEHTKDFLAEVKQHMENMIEQTFHRSVAR